MILCGAKGVGPATKGDGQVKKGDGSAPHGAGGREEEANRMELVDMWQNLHIDSSYQEKFWGAQSAGSMVEETQRLRAAVELRPPRRTWPSAPSERYRESQRLLAQLDEWWTMASVNPSHRAAFTQSHRGLDTRTLHSIWAESRRMRVLADREIRLSSSAASSECAKSARKAREDAKVEQAALRRLWGEMRMPEGRDDRFPLAYQVCA